MKIIINADGLIVMASAWGDPTPPPGGASILLSEEETAAFLTISNQPNGGITYIDAAFAALPPLPPPIMPAV